MVDAGAVKDGVAAHLGGIKADKGQDIIIGGTMHGNSTMTLGDISTDGGSIDLSNMFGPSAPVQEPTVQVVPVIVDGVAQDIIQVSPQEQRLVMDLNGSQHAKVGNMTAAPEQNIVIGGSIGDNATMDFGNLSALQLLLI